VLIGITQDTLIPSDPSMPSSPMMPFQGGCTLVGDLKKLKILHPQECQGDAAGAAASVRRSQQEQSAIDVFRR
jgi:hypothetical protein